MLARRPGSTDPQALRTVVVFDCDVKVRSPDSFVEGLALIVDRIWAKLETGGFACGGTRFHGTGLSQVAWADSRTPFVISVACQVPPPKPWPWPWPVWWSDRQLMAAFLPAGDEQDGAGLEVGVGLFVKGKRFALPAEPASYEWTVWLDALPGLWSRLFKRPAHPIDDGPRARALLAALDEALAAEPSLSAVAWHKRETLTHQELSSRADRPF
jgi:hypothetical protein